jgi:triosephosphate isomerase
MIKRNYMAAANWKLNFSIEQARQWANEYLQHYKNNTDCRVNITVLVPFPYLTDMHNLLAAQTSVSIGAKMFQNFGKALIPEKFPPLCCETQERVTA